ncbi:MAG: transcriptional repressor [Alphaproteobacteria bacterium]|nr:transcriptional repressor [Alphaproteobacteria bacterium]
MNARPYSLAMDRLRGAGLRPTRQRLALAKLLFENGHRHVTAEQLHSEALQANVRVSLATVYNTLHQFTEVSLLREIVADSGRSYFDTNTSDHHHFYFERQGRLEDVMGDVLNIDHLPVPPAGTRISRVDVVIRLAD